MVDMDARRFWCVVFTAILWPISCGLIYLAMAFIGNELDTSVWIPPFRALLVLCWVYAAPAIWYFLGENYVNRK